MRTHQALLPFFALAVLGLFVKCAPEELVYAPSGTLPDGSAGDSGDGAGGGTGWPEVCGNGIDDDLNGKTDCEDPTCGTFACVDVPPSGWTGPAAVFEGSPGSVADCPEGLANVFEGHSGLSFEAAQCTCGCGTPSGLGCSAAISYYADSSCTTLATTTNVTPPASCGAIYAGATGSVSVSFNPSGACTGGTPNPPVKNPPSWQKQARACALDAGSAKPAGCAGGKLCAPLSGESLACVLTSGDVECPAGYPTRKVYYAAYDDQRDCGTCSCGFAADSCSATLSFYATTDCSVQISTASSPGCYAAAAHAVTASNAQLQNARCESVGNSATGCVLGSQPTTVCCAGSVAPTCPTGKGPNMIEVPAPSGGTYCIDSTEVTKAQYQAFLAASPPTSGQPAECAFNTSFTPSGAWPPDAATGEHPVDYVDWCDAVAYCKWAGKRLCGKIGGGPVPSSALGDASQSQLFNACSAGGTQTQPYGATTIAGACSLNALTPVKGSPCCQGGYPGLWDMVGNAREWEDSCTPKPTDPPKHQCATRGEAACAGSATSARSSRGPRLGFRCCT